MRWKSTLFLLLANLFVFATFYIVSRKPPLLVQAENNFSSALLKDIAWIEIRAALGKETYRFERRVHDWEIIKPWRWPANTFAIEKLLTQLRFLEKEVSFSVSSIAQSNQTLADYGLQEPLLTLVLGTTQQELKLKIGQQTQVGNRLYVLDEQNQQIIAVKKESLDTLLMPKEDWYNNYLINNALGETRSLGFKNKLSQILLIKEGKEWLFKTPITAKANTIKVELLLEELQNISIIKFLEFPPIDVTTVIENNDNKGYVLTLVGDNFNQNITFYPIPKEANSYWGKMDGYERIFLIQSYAINRLLEAQETLREHQVFNFDPNSIQEIVYSSSNERVGLQRIQENQWKIFSSLQIPMKNDKADTAKVNLLLMHLKMLMAEKFVNDTPTLEELKELKLDETCTTRLILKTQAQSYELLMAETNEHFYAKLANESCVFELHPSYKNYLNIGLGEYQDKTIWEWLKTERMQSIEISHYEQCLFKYAFNPVSGQWVCVKGKDPSDKTINFILNHVNLFKTKKYLLEVLPLQWPFIDTNGLLWPYHIKFQSFDGIRTRNYDLWLSSRLGASLQIAKYGIQIFCLTQSWINALFEIIEKPSFEEAAYSLNPKP